jgi:hypothetical protein
MREIVRALHGTLPPEYQATIAGADRRSPATGPILDDRQWDWLCALFGDRGPLERMSAIAEYYGMQFVDLAELSIPKAVIELVPESVARENVVLPLELEGNTLKIITADPTNFDTVQKLQFILNKDIVPVLAIREQIQEAIDRYYDPSVLTESVAVLVERDQRAVAVVELVSPQNKNDPHAREQFAVRYLKHLRDGVHLLLVDVHPHPPEFGFGQLIAAELDQALPAPVAPSVLSYRAPPQGGYDFSPWQHGLSIGEPLPRVPLALDLEESVMVDLEATYSRATSDVS